MRIQHNIPAMNSLSKYTTNNNALAKNLEKLSSGFRINSAADDAAGLAVSEKMRAQIAGLEQAYNNTNDGISLVQTAEGALTEVNTMLTRLKTLATESSNGTYQNDVDREAIQNEVDDILSEIDRISDSTNFNGIKLLDGSLGGGGTSGTAVTGSQIATFKPASSKPASAVNASTGFTFDKEALVINGQNVQVDWGSLSAADQAKIAIDWSTKGTKAAGDEAAKIIEKTINEAIQKAGFSDSVKVAASTSGTATIFEFKSTNETNQSNIGVLGNSDAGKVGLVTSTSTGVITKLAGITQGPPTAAVGTLNGAAADYNGDFVMNINGSDYAITTSSISDTSDIVTNLQTAINNTITAYNTAASAEQQITASDITVELTNDGKLKINNGSDANISFKDLEGKSVAETLGISSESSNVSGNGLVLQVGDTNESFQQVSVSINDMGVAGLGLTGLDLKTQNSALAALKTINDSVNVVSAQRGKLGALQNRLEHAMNNLDTMTTNISSSESQIRDVNMAKEMTAYTKNNILAQAAQSMLAQANSMPQGVLQLLQ